MLIYTYSNVQDGVGAVVARSQSDFNVSVAEVVLCTGYENVINLDVGGWGLWRYGVGLGKPPDSGLLIFSLQSTRFKVCCHPFLGGTQKHERRTDANHFSDRISFFC